MSAEDGARALLRKCVHCGFCNSVCPTYLELADEQNGPRGRIWQMKSFLAGEPTAAVNLANLDLCLTCGACQSACPSGVEYLAAHDMVKPMMEKQLPRGWRKNIMRRIALAVLPHPKRVRPMIKLAQLFGLQPPVQSMQVQTNTAKVAAENNDDKTARAVLFDGCVQSAAAPGINHHAAKLIQATGIGTLEETGFCCGALQMHLGDEEKGKARIRNNVDILHRRLQNGAKWIVSTASGCGRMVASYGRVLANESGYAAKAKQVSAAAMDVGVLLAGQSCDNLQPADNIKGDEGEAVFHCPCTLTHGESAGGGAAVMAVLEKVGVKTTMPPPVCCGSAGFYSYENPKMAKTLRDKRLAVLQDGNPSAIYTANIGCQIHLQTGTKTPVRHWLDLLQVRQTQ